MEHKYLAPKSLSFKTSVVIKDGGEKLRVRCWFKKGIFTTTDDVIAAELDKALVDSIGLKTHFTKIDMKKANQIVAEHMVNVTKKAREFKPAQTGSMDTSNLHKLNRGALHASALAERTSAPNNPEALSDLREAMGSDSNMDAAEDAVLLTETTDKTAFII